MLHKVTSLQTYQLDSLDGEMGKVKEFYFDDRLWTIRYLVADTGVWLRGRQVLISPHALGPALREEKHIAVDLTRIQIEESPSLDTDMPVSRRFEAQYHGHYGWPELWMGGDPMGAGPLFTPSPLGMPTPAEEVVETAAKEEGDPHLRSTDSVLGNYVEASDGAIGHVADFIIDDESWTIRYLVIDTKNWWPGKKVLVSPEWIERVSWAESKVFIHLTREAIQNSPEYSDEALLTREYESGLHAHYEREGYWSRGSSNKNR